MASAVAFVPVCNDCFRGFDARLVDVVEGAGGDASEKLRTVRGQLSLQGLEATWGTPAGLASVCRCWRIGLLHRTILAVVNRLR
jgi:hypothetical protein